MILPSWCTNCPEAEGAVVVWLVWAEDFRFRHQYPHHLRPGHWP